MSVLVPAERERCWKGISIRAGGHGEATRRGQREEERQCPQRPIQETSKPGCNPTAWSHQVGPSAQHLQPTRPIISSCRLFAVSGSNLAILETTKGNRIKIEEVFSDVLVCGPDGGSNDSSSQHIAIYEQGLQARDFVKAVAKVCEVKFETIEDTTFALVVGLDVP